MNVRIKALAWVCALVVVAGFTGVMYRATAQNSGSAGPIALVDLERVINNLDERTARENELRSFIQERRGVIDGKQKRLDQLEDELKLLPEGAAARQTKAEEVARQRMEIQFEQQILEQLLQVKRGDVFKGLFERVLDASKRLAQARGYLLVLSNDSGARLQPGTDQQLQIQMVSRRVLYGDASLDISNDIVQMLNNEWAAGKP